MVVQYDPNLSKETIEARLKNIRGTVSWTFIPERNRAVVWVTRKVNSASIVQALSAAESSEAKIVKNFNKTMGSRRSNRSCRSTATTSIKPLPSYLEEDADLFNVDEVKGLPIAKGSLVRGAQQGGGSGVVSWLTTILERKLYW
ncbi:Armadillo repeat-containing protein 1 [Cichlidogyrus casuarinus]|uniref:Armadillo repeat-containing protein 1 n=1 Tax=Cichlidogyrus casuarinus TaxID=1844966 RepID=A0ABD2PKI3_9PLAT